MFLILLSPTYYFFSFMDHAFSIVSKKSLPNPRSPTFSLMLPTKIFIVLPFTYRSKIHFELIFVKSVKSVSMLFLSFFFWLWMYV